jgi:predicted aspartyl protease
MSKPLQDTAVYKYERLKRSNQSAPTIEIVAFAPSDKSLTAKAKAIIDTGATITCVPISVIEAIGHQNLNATSKKVVGAFRSRRAIVERESYTLNLRLGNCYFENIEVVVLHEIEYGLIGRDILNDFRIIFDGPRDAWTVEAKC